VGTCPYRLGRRIQRGYPPVQNPLIPSFAVKDDYLRLSSQMAVKIKAKVL